LDVDSAPVATVAPHGGPLLLLEVTKLLALLEVTLLLFEVTKLLALPEVMPLVLEANALLDGPTWLLVPPETAASEELTAAVFAPDVPLGLDMPDPELPPRSSAGGRSWIPSTLSHPARYAAKPKARKRVRRARISGPYERRAPA
jgi:hypothetical protein